MNVGELLWFGVLYRPQGFALYLQRKEVLGPRLRLTYLHSSPFVDGRLLSPEVLPNARLSIESRADVDSTGLMDPQGGSSVSNGTTLSACGHMNDLR